MNNAVVNCGTIVSTLKWRTTTQQVGFLAAKQCSIRDDTTAFTSYPPIHTPVHPVPQWALHPVPQYIPYPSTSCTPVYPIPQYILYPSISHTPVHPVPQYIPYPRTGQPIHVGLHPIPPIIIPSPGRGRDLEIVWFRLPYYSVVVVEVVVSHGVYLVHYSRYLDETW